MTKTEFLSLLEQRLMVLNDEERSDLLSEYKQHIEMKIQSGLSEEDAIADFGDPEELVRELLDAYHLNTSYPLNTNSTESGQPFFSRILETLQKGSRSLGRSVKSFSHTGGVPIAKLRPTVSPKQLCIRMMRFLLRCCGFLLLLFTAASALACITGTAATLIFLLQGYRTIGIFLIILGSAILSATISTVLVQFVFHRGGADL